MARTAQKQPALLLKQVEACELLGISKKTMQNLIAAGAIEPVRLVGLGAPRYRRVDLERFAQGERAGP